MIFELSSEAKNIECIVRIVRCVCIVETNQTDVDNTYMFTNLYFIYYLHYPSNISNV